MFVTVFGLALIGVWMTAANLSRDGLDQTEALVVFALIVLALLGLIMQTVIRVTEVRHWKYLPRTAETDCEPADPGQAPKVSRPERPTEAPAPPPVSSGAHTLTRTWGVRPDQQLPPGDDDPGTAEKIMRAKERGERA